MAVERGRLTGIFDRAAPLYDTLEPRFFREIARRLVARVSLAPDADVLDIATGPGVVLSVMARARVTLSEWTLARGWSAKLALDFPPSALRQMSL